MTFTCLFIRFLILFLAFNVIASFGIFVIFSFNIGIKLLLDGAKGIQYLHENIDIIDWKYEGILVSLSDGTQKYCVVENDNGQFKTREVSQEFYETLNALITKHAEINYGDYSRVKEYVERIIYNKPVTKDIVDIFIAKYNNVDATLLDLVTKHLEEKLKNGRKKEKKRLLNNQKSFVPQVGIEPTTYGFSVRRSTN